MINNIESKTIKLTQMLAVELNINDASEQMDLGFGCVVKDGVYNVFMNIQKPLELMDTSTKDDIDPYFDNKDPENIKEQDKVLKEILANKGR